MSPEEADGIFEVLSSPGTAVASQTWNRRFRAYTEMLSSGEPTEIAKVLRDMHRLKFDKELSFGERRLLDQALALLVEERALAQKSSREEVTARIEALFGGE
jgi:CarD family transcriptional regulator